MDVLTTRRNNKIELCDRVNTLFNYTLHVVMVFVARITTTSNDKGGRLWPYVYDMIFYTPTYASTSTNMVSATYWCTKLCLETTCDVLQSSPSRYLRSARFLKPSGNLPLGVLKLYSYRKPSLVALPGTTSRLNLPTSSR